jgi:hypothetical protein
MMMWGTVILALAVCLLQDRATASPQIVYTEPGKEPITVFLYAFNATKEEKEELGNKCLRGYIKLSKINGGMQPYQANVGFESMLNPTSATEGSRQDETFPATQRGYDQSNRREEESGTFDEKDDVTYDNSGSTYSYETIYINRNPLYVIRLVTSDDSSEPPMWKVEGFSPRIPPNEPWIKQLRARGYSVDRGSIVNVNPDCYRDYIQEEEE